LLFEFDAEKKHFSSYTSKCILKAEQKSKKSSGICGYDFFTRGRQKYRITATMGTSHIAKFNRVKLFVNENAAKRFSAGFLQSHTAVTWALRHHYDATLPSSYTAFCQAFAVN